MEKKEILEKEHDIKMEIIREIRKVLPNGVHEFKDKFYIHYVEGEVATTETCKAVEVCAEEGQMVKIHTILGRDTDITDGEAVLCYDISSLADILDNLKKEFSSYKDFVLECLNTLSKNEPFVTLLRFGVIKLRAENYAYEESSDYMKRKFCRSIEEAKEFVENNNGHTCIYADGFGCVSIFDLP